MIGGRRGYLDTAALLGAVLILIGGPLGFSFLTRDVFILPKLLILAFGATVLLSASAVKGIGYRGRSLTPALLLMALSMGLSCIYSTDIPTSILGPHHQQFYALVPVSICVLIYYAFADAWEFRTHDIIKMILFSSNILGAWACLQMTGIDDIFGPFMQDGRAGAMFGSPIFLGSFLALAMPLAWAESKRGGWYSFALCFAGLMAARSRGGLASGLAGVALYEIFMGEWRFVKWFALAAILGVGVYSRNHSLSDLGRLEVWRISLSIWKDSPWLGSGPDTFGIPFLKHMTDAYVRSCQGSTNFIQNSAHNDFLQVLSTLGIVGLCAYVALLASIVRLLGRAAPAQVAAAFFAVFIQAKVNPIPPTILAALAALLGSLELDPNPMQEDFAPTMAGGLRASGLALLSFCILSVVGVMNIAERYQRLGEEGRQIGEPLQTVHAFNAAATANPFTMFYTQRQLDALWSLSPLLDPASQLSAAAASDILTARSVLLHPNDPAAHEARALSLKVQTAITGKPGFAAAIAEMRVAERLAPKMKEYVAARVSMEAIR